MVALKYKEITKGIIGAAFEVHRAIINFGSKSLIFQETGTMKTSVKSINLCKSVILTSYDIIKAHGGTISLESTINEGTEFTIQLPSVGITD